jgi:DNA invertase Pin-like site-specific DNA recombinase
MMKLRNPIRVVRGIAFRVLIYARYSTEEQNPSSIDDQVAYCKQFLASEGVLDAAFEYLSDAEMSGELVSRPGIDKVRAGICARRWNLILVEDSGRLYRHETACGELIETAVDNGIRVIAINDNVDTAEEEWSDPLHDAMRHHARSNSYTAKRIKRSHDGLWRTGAAIGMLKPGYKRKPSHPATQHEPEQGPFFDELDPVWSPVIHELFERTARKDPAWLIARWATNTGLPKCGNFQSKIWTDHNVIALVRRTIYRGVDTFRSTIAKKVFRSGKRKQVRNEASAVLTREMPHLRIVPDWLWYAANDAIDNRNTRGNQPSGQEHPMAGRSRDSQGPLSMIFFCKCGGKMHMEGRAKGGYRCSIAPTGGCWNKATTLRDLAHKRIGQAIVDQLLRSDGILDVVVEHVRKTLAEEEPMKKRIEELLKEEKELVSSCNRLMDLIEKSQDTSVAMLAERLRDRKAGLDRVKAEQHRLIDQQKAVVSLPTKEEISQRLSEISSKLLDMDPEAGGLLRQFVQRITAVPFQQFGSNKVVLRAKIEMQLAAILPTELTAFFQGQLGDPMATLQPVALMVDLFEPSAGPAHFAEALRLSEMRLSLEQIGARLGISKRTAHIAVQFGKRMLEAGLTDPYIALAEAPKAASRWRRARRLDDSGSS